MPFSSLFFLSCFLPAFLALYWASPRVAKNGVTLAFSLIFYAWGAPRLLPVVVALGVIDYALGNVVARVRADERRATGAEAARLNRRARRILAAAITVHLSVLAYFKYSNFLLAETNALLAHLPSAGQVSWKEVPLPIGISFLTFEEISYLVDVYRGDARPARSLSRYLLFLMLFPHSIAGPIFRWKDLEAQLDSREHSLSLVVDGLVRFTLGLAKKVLVADAMATLVDPVFAAPAEAISMRLAWLAAVAYTLQIYFDFSGYSDMAIGLGKMAGFRFKENFDTPYVATSIPEFWKRWHISLSSWLRDYLYIPLGGSRFGERRTRINMVIVFTLSGLWHGAAWTFVVWGLYHGLLGVAERTSVVQRRRASLPRLVNIGITLVLVLVGWVFFRAPSMTVAWNVLRSMVGLRPQVEVIAALLLGRILPTQNVWVMVFAMVAVLAPAVVSIDRVVAAPRWRPLTLALVPVALVLAISQLVNGGFSPLIYFKF